MIFPILTSRRQVIVSAWSPAMLPNLALWLQAGLVTCFSDDPPVTPCIDTDPIQNWVGLGGTPTVQATSGGPPTFREQVGKYWSEPDGVDDILSGAVAVIPQPFTLYLLCRYNTSASDSIVIAHDAGGNNGWWVDFSSGGIRLTFGGVGSYDIVSADTLTVDTWYRIVFRVSAIQVRCRVETVDHPTVGVDTVSGTPNQVSLHGLTWIGGLYSSHAIAAVIAYRVDHSDEEVSAVMVYLAGLKP